MSVGRRCARRGGKVAARWGILAACAALLLGEIADGRTYAVAPPPAEPAGEAFSPLFSRRLAESVRVMDEPAGRGATLAWARVLRDPAATPLSGNPVSGCLGSACSLSYCLGSACLNSRCLGSACMVSACGGSACLTSACGGSGCLGSACGGSLCVGSVCASACVGCTGSEPEAIEAHG